MQTITTPTPPEVRDDVPTMLAHEALVALHQRSVDSAAGFATMVEKAVPEFRDVAERFFQLHESHATDLAHILNQREQTLELDGTIMGTVNKTVVTVRALFDDIDNDVMDQVRSGEEWVLSAFDNAIAALENDPTVARLHDMRAELTELLAKTTDHG